MNNRQIGRVGEEIAAEYLAKKGYEIIEKNWGNKWGEIDLICKYPISNDHKLPIIIFVEVKTKIGEDFGHPEEMVNKNKLFRVQRMAMLYDPAQRGQRQIDVIAIVLHPDLSVKHINHYEAVY